MRVQLQYQPVIPADLLEYEACTQGLLAVVFEMRKAQTWGSCNFNVFRVSDQKTVVEGMVKKVEGQEGGPKGVKQDPTT